ncbi:adenylate cyclase [Pseudoxanthobacter soli DSM 19599]|uniref:Adenylate cyclase n=1 Tax=Pseudoxanthobacter soli DSM 19599 TaxID=1123029 RepID=A0A1M7ZMY5_9HYPH|nr:adenylate/guanylate cyclase domain-containing protein [Pseudoxanthobacter soli]SHO66255.1 adenylate cyclase [Pseudoxanthobacter soli DSM 19599]
MKRETSTMPPPASPVVPSGSEGSSARAEAPSRGDAPARWTVPLGWVLGGGYGLLLFVSLVIVLSIAVTSNYNNTYSLLRDKAILVMDLLSSRISDQLAPAELAANDIASLYAAGAFETDRQDDRQMLALLEGALVGNSSVGGAVIYDRNFDVVGFYRSNDGAIQKLADGSVEALSEGDRKVLSAMPAHAGATWEPLRFTAGNLVASVAAPLDRDGQRGGYVVAAVTAEALSHVVAELGQGTRVTAFLLDSKGQVFAHSGGSALKLPDAINRNHGWVTPADIGDRVLVAYEDEDQPATLARVAGDINIDQVEVGEDSYIIITRQLNRFGAKPWTVGAYMLSADTLDQLRGLYGSVIAGIVMIVIAIALALWIARRIARSIGQLRTEADRIAALDLDAARQVPSSRIAEFDSGARAFNNMLEAVRAFSRYVPSGLVRRLMRFGFAAATRPERRIAAIMFTDLAGFTTLSEELSPEDVSLLLNRHFSALVACVEAENGTVDKFLGDGMMAVWAEGSPAENAARAARAAVAIARAVEESAAQARAEGALVLRVRIGLHVGPVIIGNLGATERVNYTTIGDTVNVASRLEAFGKTLADADAQDAVVLATGDLVQLADPGIRCAAIGATALRGRSGALTVYRILPHAAP